ncbi:MAG TPA: proton-conducting transporter membrane subunit, partial [Ohtaekwangia sp.]|nr:proton-conducting transporter membrane subunit [Ohtaekwangia sp.]
MQTSYSSLFEISLAVCVGLPLLSFLLSLLFSERYSWIMGLIAPLLLLLSCVCAVLIFPQAWTGQDYEAHVNWFRISDLEFQVGINLDNNAAVMMLVVTLISFLVHLFSTGYMAGDPGEKRYFGMLGLFTFAMQGVVLADNLLLIFVFWELVGFSSYMLIGHWRHKPSAAAAAMKAFLLNRIGDIGFIIAILIVWRTADTLSVSALAAS